MKEEHCYCKYQPLWSEYFKGWSINKEANIWQFLVHWAGCFISKCEEELVHDEKSNSNYFIYGISNIAFCMWQKRRTVRDSWPVTVQDRLCRRFFECYKYCKCARVSGRILQIQSETKPYGLTVFLKVEPSAVKIEDELQVNADMTFDLIGNLETLDYKIADSKEIIASYER